MRVNDKNGNDVTRDVLIDMYKSDGYAYVVYFRPGHKAILKSDQRDLALEYANMGYDVVDIENY